MSKRPPKYSRSNTKRARLVPPPMPPTESSATDAARRPAVPPVRPYASLGYIRWFASRLIGAPSSTTPLGITNDGGAGSADVPNDDASDLDGLVETGSSVVSGSDYQPTRESTAQASEVDVPGPTLQRRVAYVEIPFRQTSPHNRTAVQATLRTTRLPPNTLRLPHHILRAHPNAVEPAQWCDRCLRDRDDLGIRCLIRRQSAKCLTCTSGPCSFSPARPGPFSTLSQQPPSGHDWAPSPPLSRPRSSPSEHKFTPSPPLSRPRSAQASGRIFREPSVDPTERPLDGPRLAQNLLRLAEGRGSGSTLTDTSLANEVMEIKDALVSAEATYRNIMSRAIDYAQSTAGISPEDILPRFALRAWSSTAHRGVQGDEEESDGDEGEL